MLMTNSYFTMSKEKPKLLKLKNLLEMNMYMGKVFDASNDAVKVSLF
jgi:hypothetical protein